MYMDIEILAEDHEMQQAALNELALLQAQEEEDEIVRRRESESAAA